MGFLNQVGIFITYRMLKFGIYLFESNVLPDFLSRWGMRRLLETNLVPKNVEQQRAEFMAFVENLKTLPIAVNTGDANEQHYELPPEFFVPIMGARMKYSSCLFPPGVQDDDLDAAEVASLRQVEERAKLQDGLDILELGCGWGSLSLWMAERFPKSKVTSVSNSNNQRLFIEAKAKERGLTNLKIITCDMNTFQPPAGAQYDRVVSIEMFEHMKNYEKLMGNVHSWLKKGGLLFVHIFMHKALAYHFETTGEDNWMGKYFFTGGTMPSGHLLLYFAHPLKIVGHWDVNGVHYSKTLEAWLRRMDSNMDTVRPILAKVYGPKEVTRWTARWRGFFLACSELFRFNKGNEWHVAHYLFEKTM